MTLTRNRVAVLHGVNFDILERRDPEVYGGLSLRELEQRIGELGARARPRTDLLPDQPRGRVRRVPAPAAGPRRLRADQRRRLDPLQPRDRRRARRRSPARGRGPPLRRREPRRLAPRLGLRRAGRWRRSAARAPTVTARRCELLARELGADAPDARRAATASSASSAERELDRMLVTDLTNVRYLTGFTGSNGACVCGPGMRLFFTDFRYTERASAEVEGWEPITVSGDWLGGIAERLEGRVGFEDDQMPVRGLAKLKEKLADGVELVAAGGAVEELRRVKDERRAGGDRGRLGAGRRGLGAGALERGLAGRTERDVARAAEARIRELGGEPSFPRDRRRRPQRRPAARRARRARDRPRRAGRLRHGGEAGRLLLGRHPHLRHRRARARWRQRGLRGRPRGPAGRARRDRSRAPTARRSTPSPAR